MSFAVVYKQDKPGNCWECPCSVSDSKESVYCNALQKHIQVNPNAIPKECVMIDLTNKSIPEPDQMIWTEF